MTTTTISSGGRKKFRIDSRVRILLLTGDISSDVWIIAADESANKNQVRSDRNGHIIIRQENGTKEQKVHFRRILPVDVDGKALVIESNDKYRAICPGCGRVENINPSTKHINCPECGKTEVHWLGVKPMTDAVTEVQETQTEDTAKSADTGTPIPKPAVPRAKKEPKEVIRVDFDTLKALANCELWTKGHVKFDHPDVDVRAHALVFANSDTSRKLCFNTYDGALGKKSAALPIDEFINDGVVSTGKREKPWFAVKDLDKARTKLTKDGYEQQT